jgi:hypothetical protein
MTLFWRQEIIHTVKEFLEMSLELSRTLNITWKDDECFEQDTNIKISTTDTNTF